MSFKINPQKVGSINEGGRRLKVGTHPYKITGASMAVVKSNPTGKEQQIVFDLLNGTDYRCKVFLNVMSPNDVQAEIAQKSLVGFAEAANVGGELTPARLPGFVGKTVVITARETQGKGAKAGQTYTNIVTIEAPTSEDDGGDDGEAEEEDDDDETEDEESADEDEANAEEEEQEEAPEPAKPAKPVKASKKAAAAPATKSKRPW